MLLMPHSSFAQAKTIPPIEYLIRYVEHDGIINYYVPLLDRAYQKIGIKPNFVLINDQRAMRLLDKGKLDADTAKSLESIENYQNITYLPTPISKIEVYFICQLNIKCDLSLLTDRNLSLGIIGANEFYQELLRDSKIKLVEITSFNQLMSMFEQQKFDVGIIVLDDSTKTKLMKYPNHYKISEKLGYHLIHTRNKHLIPLLEQAIIDVKVEGGFRLN